MKKININNLIWFCILFCYTFFFGTLLYTGRINLFIHPKMHKYLVCALIAFSILTVFQVGKIFEEGSSSIRAGYLLLILPIVIGFSYQPKVLNGDWIEVRGLNLMEVDNISDEHNDVSSEVKIFNSQGIVELDDNNYVTALKEINNNLHKYMGKKVILEGFVYKQNNGKTDNFITARIVVSCCAADAQVLGVVCKYKDSNLLKDNQWVRVKGTIDTVTYLDENNNKKSIVPQIIVDSVQQIEEPENKYIYY